MSELKKEWYVVNTYAGQENRVKENLERRVKTMGLEDSLFQIVVAEEKEIAGTEMLGRRDQARVQRRDRDFPPGVQRHGIYHPGRPDPIDGRRPSIRLPQETAQERQQLYA